MATRMDLSDRISCTFSGPVTALGAGQGWKGSAESVLLCPLKGWGGGPGVLWGSATTLQWCILANSHALTEAVSLWLRI